MIARWLWFLLIVVPGSVKADEPKNIDGLKKEPRSLVPSHLVPYRLTDTHHTLVRVKINGKGPFNFIMDTGCPVMLIAETVGKKIGLKVEKGWSTLDKLELEGGQELTKVKARVETPFQITGMNGMGLAGVELHGLMGYTVLAKYKMELDYTKKQMIWTPLAFDPPPPIPLQNKVPTGGMDFLATMVQIMTWFAGIGPPAPPQPRGFFGFELHEKDRQVHVAHIVAGSPAEQAGLKKGDLILQAGGKEVSSIQTLQKKASTLTVGKSLRLMIERNKTKQEISITAGEGL